MSDILEAIEHIDLFLGEMDFDGYRKDPKTRSAVERQMQIITEAAIRLGDDGLNVSTSIDWKGFRGMGDILRHAYDRVVWDTVKDDLPTMRTAILRFLRQKADRERTCSRPT